METTQTEDKKPSFLQKIFMGWDKFEIIMLILGVGLILAATLIFGDVAGGGVSLLG